jgi:hypothetical protein
MIPTAIFRLYRSISNITSTIDHETYTAPTNRHIISKCKIAHFPVAHKSFCIHPYCLIAPLSADGTGSIPICYIPIYYGMASPVHHIPIHQEPQSTTMNSAYSLSSSKVSRVLYTCRNTDFSPSETIPLQHHVPFQNWTHESESYYLFICSSSTTLSTAKHELTVAKHRERFN